MAKTFLDELIMELLRLQAEDLEKIRTAVEKGESVPAPASPKKVFHTVNKVAAEHKITAEEYAALLSLRGEYTEADINLMKELEE